MVRGRQPLPGRRPRPRNNTLAASGQLAVSLPSLTLGKAATGSFTEAEQENYYQVTVPAGGSLVVSAASAAASGSLAVYVSQGTLPTPYNYQDSSAIPNQPGQTAVVPQVLTAGTYNILVESISGAAATAGYTLTVTQGSAPTISSLSTTSGGNAGNVTVAIDGTNLAPSDTATLTLGGSKSIAASSIDFVGASQIYATFDLDGACRRQLHPERSAGEPGADRDDAVPGHGGCRGNAEHQCEHAPVRPPGADRYDRHLLHQHIQQRHRGPAAVDLVHECQCLLQYAG